MKFENYLKTNAEIMEEEISRVLQEWQQQTIKTSDKLTGLVNVFIDSSTGGKYLRGGLVRLGFAISGKATNSEILQPAAAIEIFQTAILAHDDIIDLSPIRRGKPTVYRQLGGDHYAFSQTICLGDTGLFYSVQLIADSNFDDSLKNQAVSMFCQMAVNTVSGQMLDVEFPRLTLKTEVDVITIHRLKTAYYTIVYPLSIGAVLGGAKKELLDSITSFGENLGIAFQIQDDILGVFGDEKAMGKSVTSDVEEGKNTTLITKALEKANAQQKATLKKYYGTGKITNEQMEEVRKVFVDTGALDYSRQLAVQYVSAAKEVIDQLTEQEEYKQLLTEMADFLVERKK